MYQSTIFEQFLYVFEEINKTKVKQKENKKIKN